MTTAPYDPYNANARSLLARDTADGHRIVFGLASWRSDQPGPWWSWWAWWPVLGLLALTAAAFAYVRRLFKPVDDIRAGAQRFGAGDFAQPIPLRRRDELGDLAQQVNQMAANLQRMLEGQRGLLLAISHELRSPLTRARLNAELVADGAERDALVRDLALMRDLIADLLEGERLAAGPAALQTQPTDLKRLVQDEVQAVLAARSGARVGDGGAGGDAGAGTSAAAHAVSLDLAEGLPLLALDRVRMALLVRNLLGNALQHGGGSAVQISLKAEDGLLHLCVRDHGPGVDSAHLARLAGAVLPARRGPRPQQRRRGVGPLPVPAGGPVTRRPAGSKRRRAGACAPACNCRCRQPEPAAATCHRRLDAQVSRTTQPRSSGRPCWSCHTSRSRCR